MDCPRCGKPAIVSADKSVYCVDCGTDPRPRQQVSIKQPAPVVKTVATLNPKDKIPFILTKVPERPQRGPGINNRTIHAWYDQHKVEIMAEITATDVDATFSRWKIPLWQGYRLKKEWGITTRTNSIPGRKQVKRVVPRENKDGEKTEVVTRVVQIDFQSTVVPITVTDLSKYLNEGEFSQFWSALGKIIRKRIEVGKTN